MRGVFRGTSPFVCLIFIVWFGVVSNSFARCPAVYPILGEIGGVEKYGFIDCNGRVIVKPSFNKMLPFQNGRGVLLNEGLSLLVSVDGSITRMEGIQVITQFSEGVAVAKKGGLYVLIDDSGRIVSHLNLNCVDADGECFIGSFSNGLIPFGTPNGIGFVDKKGVFVIPPKFASTSGFDHGIAIVQVGHKFGVINREGSFVFGPVDDAISGLSEGVFVVQLPNRTWRYLDDKGKTISTLQMDYVGRFADGLAMVNHGESWGFVNRDGVVSVPLAFSDAREFSEGLAAVKKNDKWGFINSSGRFSIAPIFDFVHSSFEGGLSYVRLGTIQGYIDRNGRWIWTRSD